MEEFIMEALREFVECHEARIVASVHGLEVVAVVDLGDGKGLKRFRITATPDD